MSAKNTETLTFVSLKIFFLAFVHCHNELFFSYLWSFIRKFISSDKIKADEERATTHCLIIYIYIYNRFMVGFVYAEVYTFKVTSL